MRYNVPKGCAARSCRALRRRTHMCSSNLSDAANMSRHGSTLCSPTVEKILCRSPVFEAVTCRQSAPGYQRERGDSQEGGNRRCLPSCAPARRQRTPPPRGAARSRRPQTANPPLRFSEKLSARQGRTRLRSSRTPLSRCREKGCRPDRVNPLTQFVSPA